MQELERENHLVGVSLHQFGEAKEQKEQNELMVEQGCKDALLQECR